MKDEHKAKEQLINELAEMRRRIARLEAADAERKRAEESLRESEARYRAVVEDQTELICRFQPDGTLTFVNEAYCRYFGKRLEELIGHNCMPLIPEEDREFVWQQMASLSLENPVGNYEHRVVTPSGEIRWQQWTDRAIYDEQGRLVEYQSVGRDITERKLAEEEIERRNRELAALNAITATMMQSALNLKEVLQLTADGVVQGLGCNTAIMFLLDEEEGVFKGRAVSTRAKILKRINAIIGFPVIQLKIPARSDFNEAASNLLDGRITIKHNFHELAGPLLSRPVCSALQGILGSRTFLGLPLLARGAVIGGIFASTREELNEADAEKLMTFANQAAIAIENARLHEETKQHTIELEQRAKRLAVINRVSAAISSFLDWNEVLNTTVRELVGLFGVEHSGILIFDKEKEWGHVLAEYPDWGATAERFQVKGYLAAERIIADQKPLIIEDTLKDPLVARVRDTMRRLGIKSMLIVPLVVKGETIGSIGLDAKKQRVFSQEDIELAQTIANQAAIAIRNVQLFQAEREQRDRAEALEEAAAVVSSTLDPDQVLDRVLEQVSRVVPNDAANIMLIEGDQARVVRWRGYERFGTEEFVSTVVFRIPEVTNLQQMLESREPMVIPDTDTCPDWVRIPVTEWLRSYAAAPIIVRGEVIGFLNVDSATPGFFTQAHAEALRVFADHAATAIENARLYGAERRHSAELEALRQASLHLTSALELQPILEAILDHAFKLVAADDVHIFLYDGERLTFGAALWEDGRQKESYAEPRPQGLTYTVACSGERIVVPDVNSHPLFRDYQWGGSIVGLPLRIGERVMGVMNVAFERPHVFDESELRVLGLLADQAAIAIDNARLYEETRQRALEQETLREAALALTTALDRNEVIERILAQLQQVVPYDSASVQLLREDQMEIVGGRGFPNLPDLLGTLFPVDGDNPNQEVIRTQAPFIVKDAPTVYEGFQKGPHMQTVIRSWLGVPMLIGERLVGMIALDKSEPEFYTQEHARLAEAFAAQAAVAIENARLFEEERRRATQLALINEVGEKVASILDSDRLMQEVTRSIQESFNYYNVALFLLDEERGEVVMQAVSGGFEHIVAGDYRQSLDEGIVGFVARTGDAWLANDISKSPYYTKGFLGEVLTKSELCVPIKLGNEVIGALDVQSIHLDAFDQEDVAALEAVADRLAMGIQNARLYEEMAGLYDVGLAVTSALELNKTLRVIYEQVNHLMSLDTFYIALYDEAGEELRFEIFVEEGEWLPKFTRKLDEGGLTAWIVQSRKPLFIGNFEKEGESLPAVPGQVGKPETRSWLGFPLLARDKVVGVISVQSFRPHAFTKEDERILSAFANQAAVAVENARLYEETKRRAEELAVLHATSLDITAPHDLPTLLQTIVERAARLLDAPGGGMYLCDPDRREVRCVVSYNTPRDYTGTVLKYGEGLAGTMAETGEPLIIDDYRTWPGRAAVYEEEQPFTAILSAPMIWQGQVTGVIHVLENVEIRRFTQANLELLSLFANQAAIAIENAHLFGQLEERRVYLEGVLGAAPDAIVTLDARHRIVEWNSGAERLFGYSREEVIGQNIDHLVTNPDVFEEAVEFTQVVMAGMEVPPIETVRYRKDGSPVDVLLAGSPILVGDEFIGAVAVYTDITERVRMEETLRSLALLDNLTDLFNRRGFFTLAEQQLKAAERAKRRMVLLFTDFDGLKQINDTFGHSEGDRALIETADVLRETFRESDIIARIGGDEFVVMAIETNGSPAEVLITRLQENLKARNAREDRHYKLSLSVGLARYDPEHPCSIDELLARADKAMYERKQGDDLA